MVLDEFNKNEVSTFSASDIARKIDNFPIVGVTCFSQELIDRYVELYDGKKIAVITNANGEVPVYEITYKGKKIAVFMSRVGAPACTVGYEEVLAMGLQKLVVFGTCGVLDKNINDLAIIIPTSAIRDEGTSYHYDKVYDEVKTNLKYKDEFINILKKHDYSYVQGKVWTTDAPYRETREKVAKRKNQGCICVDMECSALTIVANFRNKELFQFFYAADNLDNAKWDMRSLGNHERLSDKERIIIIALEQALQMLK